MWAYPLKQKDHAASTIKEDWLPFVQKQAECVVKRIKTDRGGEFLGAETTAWLKKQGIQRELFTAYSPQSNGVAERANRTILETAKALLIESGVGNSMWPHAVRHATVARNRVLTKVGNESLVRLEGWLGRKPPVDMLRVFGCMAVANVPEKYRSKLGASAIWCVHLGLAAESKGWLLWEPSKDVLFDSRDVKFVEGMMYGGWKKQPETKVSKQMEQITMQLDLFPSVWEEGEEAAAEAGDGEKVQEAPAGGGDDVETSGSTKKAAGSEGGEQQLRKAKVPALPSRRKPNGVVMREWETPVSRPGRTRMATMKPTAGADVAEEQLGNEEALLDEEDEPAYCFLAPAPEEPASMEEALAGPDSEKWLVSRDAEYQSLLENGTWDLVVLPEGKKAVQCKWVLRIKTDDKGQVTIYKSRLVAKGFMQKEKQDFNEIFAPTAKPPTLRVLLADATSSPSSHTLGVRSSCMVICSICSDTLVSGCFFQPPYIMPSTNFTSLLSNNTPLDGSHSSHPLLSAASPKCTHQIALAPNLLRYFLGTWATARQPNTLSMSTGGFLLSHLSSCTHDSLPTFVSTLFLATVACRTAWGHMELPTPDSMSSALAVSRMVRFARSATPLDCRE
ncbi:unnamed protein product [Closterium sp. NIES-53]